MRPISNELVPVKRSDLVTTDAGDQLLVHYPGLRDPISLNTSAQAILDLCDGKRTIAQLSHQLAEEFGYPLNVLTADVTSAVMLLDKFGVIELHDTTSDCRDIG